MKKVKLLTSLSTLSLVAATVPVVSTSCSEQFNFDGEYKQEDVFGSTGAISEQWYNNDWIKDNFRYKGKNWSTPKDLNMDSGYNDPKAIKYLNDNIKSVKQFVGCIIYSLMWTYVEANRTAYPVKFRISESDFVYNRKSKTFSFDFTFELFDYIYYEYVPDFKVRTRQGAKLKILRECEFSDDVTSENKLMSIAVGQSFDANQMFVDFGLEINLYNGLTFSSWQDLNTLNEETKDYVDGVGILYVPAWLFNGGKFKDTNLSVWIYDRYNQSSEDYFTPSSSNNVIKFKSSACDGTKIFLYPILLNVNGVLSLMNAYYKVNAYIRNTEALQIATVNANGSMFGIIPGEALKRVKNAPLVILIEFTLSTSLSYESDFEIECES